MTQRRGSAALAICRIAQLMLIPATLVACLAVHLGMQATRDGLRQASSSLAEAEPLVRDLATMSGRMSELSGTLGTGLDNSSQSLAAVSKLTTTVAGVADVIAPLFGNVRQAAADLRQSVATFDALAISTQATKAELTAAKADLTRAAAAANELPELLRTARSSVEQQQESLNAIEVATISAIVLFAFVLFLLLQAVANIARQQRRLQLNS